MEDLALLRVFSTGRAVCRSELVDVQSFGKPKCKGHGLRRTSANLASVCVCMCCMERRLDAGPEALISTWW